MSDTNLKIELSANDQTASAFAALNSRLQKIEKTSDQVSSSFSNLGTTLITAFAGLQIARGIKSAVDLADTYKTVNARIKLVSESTDAFKIAQDSLFTIAQKTRIEFASTAELYAQLARGTKDLNVPQEKMLKLTEGINKALVVSGASGASASAALIQLSQGFASGVLRGQEFMSVQEQAPMILNTVKNGLGITQKALKSMADEGKLTTEVFIKGFLAGMSDLDKEFNQIPVTVTGAMTVVKNQLLKTVGDMDSATGATKSLGASIASLAKTIESLGKAIIENKESIGILLKMAGMAIGVLAAVAAVSKLTGAYASLANTIKANPVLTALILGTAISTGVVSVFTSDTAPKDIEDARKKYYQVKKQEEEARKNLSKLSNQGLNKSQLTARSEPILKEIELYQKLQKAYVDYVQKTFDEQKKQETVKKKPIIDSSLSKEQQTALQKITDQILNQTAGERALAEEQAKRIGLSGKQLDNYMAQFDILSEIKREKELTAEVEKVLDGFNRKSLESAKKLSEEDKRQKNIITDFRNQMDSYREMIKLKGDNSLMSKIELDTQERLLSVDKAYITAKEQITRTNGKNTTERLAQLDKEKLAIDGVIMKLKEQALVQQNDIFAGGKKGYAAYLDDIKNFSTFAEDATTRAFRGMEDALVNFVKTGKLSFTDLANSIITDLIRIQVRKQITGFLGDLGSMFGSSDPTGGMGTTGLDGSASGGLSFAGGGYTGAGSRSGGADGKGGFMAMLHPNETVIDHAKGQSTGGTTIVQNLNISTGVSQTVRAEVMSMMPMIANAAKSAVADGKLRGGSYGMALR